MGMFDTFHIQDQGRRLAVQSKQFARMLGDYRRGDFVEYETTAPRGVQTCIEDHKQDWSDLACPTEWIVLLLIEGCFLDAYVASDEAEARNAADVMAKLWQSPERQAEAFQRHARAHYQALTTRQRALDRVSGLLRDYAKWQEREAKGEADTSFFGFMRHDFNKETWDWAIARLLLELPEYREWVPAGYGVGAVLAGVNPVNGEKA
ncbi:MAG: hypothetical protein Q8O79_01020 [Pseudomonadota bacterium]|nr:hypothetical protein [Pseudomonadota bacterium]